MKLHFGTRIVIKDCWCIAVRGEDFADRVTGHEKQTYPGKTHSDIQATLFDAVGRWQYPVS